MLSSNGLKLYMNIYIYSYCIYSYIYILSTGSDVFDLSSWNCPFSCVNVETWISEINICEDILEYSIVANGNESYFQLEAIMVEMQDQKNGVKGSEQKLNVTTIPHVIAGKTEKMLLLQNYVGYL